MELRKTQGTPFDHTYPTHETLITNDLDGNPLRQHEPPRPIRP